MHFYFRNSSRPLLCVGSNCFFELGSTCENQCQEWIKSGWIKVIFKSEKILFEVQKHSFRQIDMLVYTCTCIVYHEHCCKLPIMHCKWISFSPQTRQELSLFLRCFFLIPMENSGSIVPKYLPGRIPKITSSINWVLNI